MKIGSSEANIIDELFVRTADENYITARWCAIHHLHTDFAWLALHALEKYLKAVLLYNGRPAKKQGHDILKLYRTVQSVAPRLLPKMLTKPPDLVIGHWFDRTPENFLEHLFRNGNPDNRYLIYGHDTRTEDLHMLDAMVFAVRRLICKLDDPIVQQRGIPKTVKFPTHREVLLRQPDWCSNQFMPLDDLMGRKVDDEVRDAALNLNLSFAPEAYDHGRIRGGDASRVPVLLRRILEPMKRTDKIQVQEAINAANWLLKNVKLPGDGRKVDGVAKQIRNAIDDAERRIGGRPPRWCFWPFRRSS
jgi:hypothetical protein